MGRGLWIGLGTLGVVAGVSLYGLYRLATTYVDFGVASGELDAAVAAYRRDGLPWTADELAPRARPETNAAPALRAALAAAPGKKADARVADEMKKADGKADAVLAPYARSLALLHDARARGAVDFKRDWDLGPDLLFPEYAGLKGLARAAVLRATQEAARGDDAAAVRDLGLARQIGVWSGAEPSLIAMLVRLAIEAIALDGAERCLAAVASRPERVARYGAWLKAAPPTPSFGKALRGETFLGVTLARNLDLYGGMDSVARMGNPDEPTPRLDPTKLRRDGLPDGTQARAFLTRHLQYWDEVYRATGRFGESAEEIGKRLDRMEHGLETKKGLSYVLLRIMVPVFSQAGAAVTNLQAKRAVEAGFAEALTTHALTGRWPTRVAGVDPFTGGPLRVKVGKGFRVYSVGRDRKDDGGLLRREAPKKAGATYDEVAVYPPVAR